MADSCEPAPSIAIAGDCAASLTASSFQTVGGVQQRGGQTRTVGVPREFLVAALVLLAILLLA
jgi:hypothetical protein